MAEEIAGRRHPEACVSERFVLAARKTLEELYGR